MHVLLKRATGKCIRETQYHFENYEVAVYVEPCFKINQRNNTMLHKKKISSCENTFLIVLNKYVL